MDDLISRRAVLDTVDSYSGSQSNVEDVTQDIISDIVALPPVTPKQKMGRWLKVDDEEPIAYDCSECGAMVSRRCRFCPDCGAKMEESEDKEVHDEPKTEN